MIQLDHGFEKMANELSEKKRTYSQSQMNTPKTNQPKSEIRYVGEQLVTRQTGGSRKVLHNYNTDCA